MCVRETSSEGRTDPSRNGVTRIASRLLSRRSFVDTEASFRPKADEAGDGKNTAELPANRLHCASRLRRFWLSRSQTPASAIGVVQPFFAASGSVAPDGCKNALQSSLSSVPASC